MPPRIGPKKPVRVYLALWREKEGLSQEQLGLRITPHVDKGTVSRWENAAPGRLTLGVIAAYAEALGKQPVAMYLRPPPGDQKPTLDDQAEGLDEAAISRIEGFIEGLKIKKAS